jgi:hypothetical protein
MTPTDDTASEPSSGDLEETFNWHRIRRLNRKG